MHTNFTAILSLEGFIKLFEAEIVKSLLFTSLFFSMPFNYNARSPWSRSSGGLQRRLRDWSISLRMMGWGSWACSVEVVESASSVCCRHVETSFFVSVIAYYFIQSEFARLLCTDLWQLVSCGKSFCARQLKCCILQHLKFRLLIWYSSKFPL